MACCHCVPGELSLRVADLYSHSSVECVFVFGLLEGGWLGGSLVGWAGGWVGGWVGGYMCRYVCTCMCAFAYEEEEEEICLFNIVCRYPNSAI